MSNVGFSPDLRVDDAQRNGKVLSAGSYHGSKFIPHACGVYHRRRHTLSNPASAPGTDNNNRKFWIGLQESTNRIGGFASQVIAVDHSHIRVATVNKQVNTYRLRENEAKIGLGRQDQTCRVSKTAGPDQKDMASFFHPCVPGSFLKMRSVTIYDPGHTDEQNSHAGDASNYIAATQPAT